MQIWQNESKIVVQKDGKIMVSEVESTVPAGGMAVVKGKLVEIKEAIKKWSKWREGTEDDKLSLPQAKAGDTLARNLRFGRGQK